MKLATSLTFNILEGVLTLNEQRLNGWIRIMKLMKQTLWMGFHHPFTTTSNWPMLQHKRKLKTWLSNVATTKTKTHFLPVMLVCQLIPKDVMLACHILSSWCDITVTCHWTYLGWKDISRWRVSKSRLSSTQCRGESGWYGRLLLRVVPPPQPSLSPSPHFFSLKCTSYHVAIMKW